MKIDPTPAAERCPGLFAVFARFADQFFRIGLTPPLEKLRAPASDGHRRIPIACDRLPGVELRSGFRSPEPRSFALRTHAQHLQALPEGPRLLAGPQVQAKTSLSRCTIWRLARRGTFPAPVQVSPGRVAWSEQAVDAWIAERLASGAAL